MTYSNLAKASLSGLLDAKVDKAKQFVGQLATKGYFVGEATGYDISRTSQISSWVIFSLCSFYIVRRKRTRLERSTH